jgi:hypothetical protein
MAQICCVVQETEALVCKLRIMGGKDRSKLHSLQFVRSVTHGPEAVVSPY